MPGRYSFPRSERLTTKSQYRFVFEQGEKHVGQHFICYLVRRENKGCKLGFAVSRKVGNAVVRNRVKRYLREYYRTHRPDFTVAASLVIVARPASAGLDYHECAGSLGQLLRRGGLLHG